MRNSDDAAVRVRRKSPIHPLLEDMMTFTRQLMAVAVASAFALAGNAVAMTKAEIKVENDQIAAQFKSAQAQCESLKANAKDICVAEAKGANKVAKAEFE